MLAIVIPYYKLIFFEATLQSLVNQTNKGFKVYIGDDASPENPSDLIEKCKGQFDFVYHRFETNLGSISLVKQWERCIQMTQDEHWIMILGDDDYLDLNVVEQFYFHFKEFKKSNVIRFASQMVFENMQSKSKVFTHPIYEKATNAYLRKVKGVSRSSMSEYFFSKEIYLKYGFKDYPLGWHSDDKAWLDFSGEEKIYSINESIVYVRVSEISISGKTDNLEMKYLAKISFLQDVILQNLVFFSKLQRLEIVLDFESKVKLKRKLTLKEWKWMLRLYISNFKIIPFLKFSRRFFKSILSN